MRQALLLSFFLGLAVLGQGCAQHAVSVQKSPLEQAIASVGPSKATEQSQVKGEASTPQKAETKPASSVLAIEEQDGVLGPRILRHEDEIVEVEPIRLTYYEEILDQAVGPEKSLESQNKELEELFRLQRKRFRGKHRRMRALALRKPRSFRVYTDQAMRLRAIRGASLPPMAMSAQELAFSVPPTLAMKASAPKHWSKKLRALVPKYSSVSFKEWERIISDAGRRYGLDPLFIAAIIKAESNFDPRSVSPVGAQGAMQIMPGTQVELGLKDPFDVRANVFAGTAYIRSLLRMYPATELALAAYNAGPYAVKKAKGIPPYVETRQYVHRVLGFWLDRKLDFSVKTAQAENRKNTTLERQTSKTGKAKKDRGKREKG